MGYCLSLLSPSPPPPPYLIHSAKAKELQAAHQPRYGSHDDYLKAIAELRAYFANRPNGGDERVSVDPSDLETHGISEWSYHDAKRPTVVVWADNTEEVKEVVDISRRWRVPITPYSGGTSLEGHFSSVRLPRH